MKTNDDERFEAWQSQPTTLREQAFADRNLGLRSRSRSIGMAFIGGIDSERTRVREIADRIEAAVQQYTKGDDRRKLVVMGAEDLLALVKELKNE